jgi:PAS domain S-box-containing protein
MSFGSDPANAEQLKQHAPASLDWRAFHLALSEALRPLDDPIAIQRAACRVLAEFLDADAVQYSDILERGTAAASQEYVRSGAGSGRQHVARAFGEQALAAFKAGVSLVVHDVAREPQLSAASRAAFESLGIASASGTGLVKDGRWVATLTATCTASRTWTSMHVAMLEETIERTWTAADHARIEAALRENEERQAFLLTLGDTVRRLGDPAAILAETCRLLGKHLHVNRVAYGEFDGDDCTIVDDYVDGVASMAGRFRWTPFEGDFADELSRRDVLVVRDTATDPRTASARDALKAADIGAFITPLLVKDGRYVGALGIHSRAPRAWTQSEITLVREVAERIWAALEQYRAEVALRDSEARLEFLLKLNDVLQPLSDPVERQSAAARLLCEHLRVTRVCYADISDEFVVRHSYMSGAAPSIGRGPLSRVGTVLMSAYERGAVVSVNDVRTDSRFKADEKAALLAGEIAAFAGLLIWKNGHRHGAFGVHSATPRVWSSAEVSLIRDVGERTWEAVERASAEEELREREWRLRLALNASGGGSWMWDAATNYIDWDDGFRARYGFARDQTPTHEAWLSRVHEDDRAHVVGLRQDMLHTSKDSWDNTFRIVLTDGSVRWIQSLGRAERAADGQVLRLTGLDLDITERRLAEDAMTARRDEERDRELRLLLETATQGIVSVDARGLIVTANHAMEMMFGWEKGELIGQSIERLLPSSLRGAHATHRTAYFAAPSPRVMGRNMDLVGQRKDGSTFPIEVNLNHVATRGGGRAIAFVTDISAWKRAETTLHERTVELQLRTTQLSKMASDLTLAEQHAREQLAKTLHDGLQQLLVGAAMHLELQARRDAQLGAPPAELLVEARHHIDEAVAAARSLSFELFPPVLHHSGLPSALTWLADWTRQKYGLEVRVSADPRANSDRKDVRTLLFESVRELLFNAVKHAQADRATVDLRAGDDDELCITVADEGIGFDPAALADQSKSSQVGWGLFSIRERLTLLGGRFEIQSAPGRGTKFRLIAPGREAQVPAALTTLESIAPIVTPPPVRQVVVEVAPRPLRILIVDDHAAMRKALRGLLQARSELQVVGEAANGLDAIAEARAHQPDVVLMDVSMPEMDGVEATRRIHTELPFIQVLGLSMQLRTDVPHAIERAGATGFFTKGIDTQRLIDKLVTLQAATSGWDRRVTPT